ncbi:MAG TPA: cell division protein FtsL [Steroidobacteraceae bacterium]|nr:cell division protein FtsL [Steroidobacteraceae bacterium]
MKTLPRALVWFGLPALWLAVLLSATGAIYCKHRARELFVELERLNSGRDELEAEWGRLQIEQSFWSTYGYVENVASTRLHMRIPASNDIKMPTP